MPDLVSPVVLRGLISPLIEVVALRIPSASFSQRQGEFYLQPVGKHSGCQRLKNRLSRVLDAREAADPVNEFRVRTACDATRIEIAVFCKHEPVEHVPQSLGKWKHRSLNYAIDFLDENALQSTKSGIAKKNLPRIGPPAIRE